MYTEVMLSHGGSRSRFVDDVLTCVVIVPYSAGASPAFKQKELAVVGGGDTALEEAVYLTKYGKHVSAASMI